jgi:hypothetical protein
MSRYGDVAARSWSENKKRSNVSTSSSRPFSFRWPELTNDDDPPTGNLSCSPIPIVQIASDRENVQQQALRPLAMLRACWKPQSLTVSGPAVIENHVNEPDFQASEDLDRAIVDSNQGTGQLCLCYYGLCQGKILFQSCFMLTTIHPRCGASSKAWSSLPKGDLRS